MQARVYHLNALAMLRKGKSDTRVYPARQSE